MSACSTVEMSSSGRNDLSTNANAPERSAPIAASIAREAGDEHDLAERRRRAQRRDEVDAARVRELHVDDGHVEASRARRWRAPRRRATRSPPRSPATPPCRRTARARHRARRAAVPTSSTLSSTMSTRDARRRRRDPQPGHRGRAHARSLCEDLVHELRVRAALRLLHHLADEEAHEAGLAGAVAAAACFGFASTTRAHDAPRSPPRRSPAASRARATTSTGRRARSPRSSRRPPWPACR